MFGRTYFDYRHRNSRIQPIFSHEFEVRADFLITKGELVSENIEAAIDQHDEFAKEVRS